MNISQSQSQSQKSARAKAALDAYVAQSKSKLDDVESKLGSEAPQLTADDKRRTAKFRRGAERIIPHIGTMLTAAGIDTAGLSVEQMISDLERAQSLAELQRRVEALLKRVGDEVFAAQASSWNTAMAGYALLQRKARNNGDIAAQLEPVTTFFAYRTPAVEAKKVPVHVRRSLAEVRKAQARIDAHVAKAKEALEHLQGAAAGAQSTTTSPSAPPVGMATTIRDATPSPPLDATAVTAALAPPLRSSE